MNHIKLFTLAALAILTPVSAKAAPDFSWLTSVFTHLSAILEMAIPVLVAIALLLFIWGLVVFIAKSGDESAKEEGKRKMIWGIIALFVIMSVWGLVNLLSEITGVSGEDVTSPTVIGGQGTPGGGYTGPTN